MECGLANKGEKKWIWGGGRCIERGKNIGLYLNGMWSGSIIRKNTRKSHFPADMSGKLSEVCQVFDLASSIITLKTYYYTINKCPLQMEGAKGTNKFLLMSGFQWLRTFIQSTAFGGVLRLHWNTVVKNSVLTRGVYGGLAGKNGSCLLWTRELRHSLLQLWRGLLLDPPLSPSLQMAFSSRQWSPMGSL